jgi:hypothetical protein
MSSKSLKIVQNASHYWKKPQFFLNVLKKPYLTLKKPELHKKYFWKALKSLKNPHYN